MPANPPVSFAEVATLVDRRDVSEWITIDGPHLRAFWYATYLTAPDLGHDAVGPPPGDKLVDGFLLLSLTAHAGHAQPVLDPASTYAYNYGVDRVRFTRPVLVGEQVRLQRVVAGVRMKTPTRALIRFDGTIEVRGDERPAAVASWLALYVDETAEAAP